MQLSDGVWPDRLPAVEVRIARPTDKLAEVLDFYCGDLGLPELFRSAGDGYQVVMVGLPGDKYHLEFTSRDDGSPGRAPTDENRLVFYFATADQMFDVVTRLDKATEVEYLRHGGILPMVLRRLTEKASAGVAG